MPRNPAKKKTQPPKPKRPKMELVRNDQIKVPKPTEEPTQPTPDPTPKTSEALTEMMLKAHQSEPALEPGEERSVPEVTEPSETTVLVEIGGIDKRILGTVVDPDPIEEEPPAPPVQVIERRIETVTVEIPLGEPPTIPPRVHIEVLLRRDHAHTFARLRQGLRDKGAKTANGRLVDTKPDVVRWLLEQFTGGLGK